MIESRAIRIGIALLLFAVLIVAGSVLFGSLQTRADDPQRPQRPSSRPTLTPQELAQAFHPGAPWDGRGKGNMTQADAEAFSAFSLLWLGPAFSGYNLQVISRVQYGYPPGVRSPNGSAGVDEVRLVYGECEPIPNLERSSCPVPFQIIINSVCYVRPEQVSPAVKAEPLARTRGGAISQRYGDGHVDVWTGRTFLSLDGGHEGLVTAALARLEGLSTSLAVRANEDLPPPDFSGCPSPPGIIPTPIPRR